jgi:hypothetical protein
MGNVYKDKKSKGCALCKPHKHGWAPKKKPKETAAETEAAREIVEFALKDNPELRRNYAEFLCIWKTELLKAAKNL